MTTIWLHGVLAKEFGKKIKVRVNSAKQAVYAMTVLRKGLRRRIIDLAKQGQQYELIVDNQTISGVDEFKKQQSIKEIHLVPSILGSSDTLKTIAGAILIVVGVVLGWTGWGMFFISLGMSLLTSGIMGLLAPKPQDTESQPQAKSFLFSSPANTTVQGAPVPIAYGRLRIGSRVISAKIRPEDLSSSRQSTYANVAPYDSYQLPRDHPFLLDFEQYRRAVIWDATSLPERMGYAGPWFYYVSAPQLDYVAKAKSANP